MVTPERRLFRRAEILGQRFREEQYAERGSAVRTNAIRVALHHLQQCADLKENARDFLIGDMRDGLVSHFQ